MKPAEDRRAQRLASLAKTLIDARPVLRRQAEDWAEGFPANTDTTHTIGRTSGDRVLAQVEADLDGKPRPGHGLAEACIAEADAIDHDIANLYRRATNVLRLLPMNHPVAEMLAKHAQARFNGAGYCDACGDWVEGADYNPDRKTGRRIIQGLCPKHYEYWRANIRPTGVSSAEWATREAAKRKAAAQNETPGCHPQSA